jgi:hypothetical protein
VSRASRLNPKAEENLMKFRTSLIMAIVALSVLSFGISQTLASEMPVIGKAHVKKGTMLVMLVMMGPGMMPMTVEAFEDQTLYIIEKVPADDEQSGGYIADGEGFVHNCPTHGREVLSGLPTMVMLPNDFLNSENGKKNVTITLLK